MTLWLFTRLMALALSLTIVAPAVSAQVQPDNDGLYFVPGKDVVWIPTSQEVVGRMLDLAKIAPRDYVIDLGSGDGRLVIAAAKRGARALGVEYNPDLVALSKQRAAEEGVADKADFVRGDLFETDFSQATVITLFLMPHVNLKLRPRILNLKPGTRIVANTFGMGEWKEDQAFIVKDAQKCSLHCAALLWIVPAKVEGSWRSQEGTLTLAQRFQMVSGTVRSGSDTLPIRDGHLIGDQISFSAGNSTYTGTVRGTAIEGTSVSRGSTTEWSATRIDGQ
jgi:SAM-dependent methyltransferase